MNDEELEEYIKKVEPNFDYNAHTGTIEMSNEYYNLLEEKMTRLINKNKQLQQERDKYKSIVEMVKEDISWPGYKFIEMYHMKEKQTPVYFVYEYKQDLKTKIQELEEGGNNERNN